jgi:TolB-like protein/tetratricopeptide (TPR) repeat protein
VSSHAVFLSYASEDAAAAERIATALSSAGIEVWFDKSELRGGDAWDRRIREQIHDCRLFIPVISANSERRDEGYFRREWALAADRTRDMAHKRAFLVPVVIDGTSERGASVPEKFHELQWTRLPGGDTTPEFVERIRRLLSPQTSSAADAPRDVPGFTAAMPTIASRAVGRWRWGAILLAAMAVLALAYFGLDSWVLSRHAVSGAGTKSVAVLPLKNESGDPSQQYFSDGISEDLITALSQVPGLKVIGRASSFHFRDSTEDSRTIAQKLGVAHLIEGSVRRAGDTVRVSAELVNAADGSTAWSERYDRPYKDLFALQDEITRAVAGALRTKLLPGEQVVAQSERPPGGSLEAYNALLQGRFYTFRNTEADWRKAIEFFTQATHLDPRYALAWSELSRAWTFFSGAFLEGAAAQEAYAKARAAGDRALTLAPDLAAAHNARGDLLQSADFDWHGAEAEYRRARELAPNDVVAKLNLGAQLAAYGELDQAIELTRQALVTEPLRAGGYRDLATYFLGLHRLDEAERAIDKAIELQPAAPTYHAWHTIIEIQRRNAPAALEAAQRTPPGVYGDMAVAFARQIGGDQNAADAALRTLIEKWADNAAYQIAEVYALRNDDKATFEWLDRAWSNRDTGIQQLLYGTFIMRYKDDPRFAAFCRKVGLPTPAEIGRRT